MSSWYQSALHYAIFFKFLVASLNQSLYLQQLQLDFRHSQLCTLQPNYCKYICCQRFEEFLADFEAGVFSRGWDNDFQQDLSKLWEPNPELATGQAWIKIFLEFPVLFLGHPIMDPETGCDLPSTGQKARLLIGTACWFCYSIDQPLTCTLHPIDVFWLLYWKKSIPPSNSTSISSLWRKTSSKIPVPEMVLGVKCWINI